MLATVSFNPWDPAFVTDPYRFYGWWRESDPVHYEDALPGWLISRYDHVSRLMGDPRLINPHAAELYKGTPGHYGDEYTRLAARTLLFANPPKHGRVRKVFGKVFRPAVLEGYRPAIREVVRDLIDGMANADRVEFVSEAAQPLTVAVMMCLLDLPLADTAQVGEWALAMAHGALKSVYGHDDPAAIWSAANEATPALKDYLARAIEARRHSPDDGILSTLIQATASDPRMTPEELVDNVILLFSTSASKASYYLSSAVLVLLRNSDQLRLLRDDPAVVESAVDELLRYESPVQIAVPQRVAEDLELDGRLIKRGQLVYLVLGSANRDPARFSEPDKLDLRRPPGQHVGFGVGPHNCLGSALARIDGQEVLPYLVRRYPELALDVEAPEPTFAPVPFVRHLTSLPVRLVNSPAGRSQASSGGARCL